MVLFAFFIFTGNAFSGGMTAKMNISVKVLPVVDYEILLGVPDIEVTPEDLLQGYKDITEGTVISVFTNNPDGYVLLVCGGIPESFSAVTISAGSDLFNMPSEGCTEIYSSSHGMLKERRQLDYRIYFSPETREGTYSLPVAVTAYPL